MLTITFLKDFESRGPSKSQSPTPLPNPWRGANLGRLTWEGRPGKAVATRAEKSEAEEQVPGLSCSLGLELCVPEALSVCPPQWSPPSWE